MGDRGQNTGGTTTCAPNTAGTDHAARNESPALYGTQKCYGGRARGQLTSTACPGRDHSQSRSDTAIPVVTARWTRASGRKVAQQSASGLEVRRSTWDWPMSLPSCVRETRVVAMGPNPASHARGKSQKRCPVEGGPSDQCPLQAQSEYIVRCLETHSGRHLGGRVNPRLSSLNSAELGQPEK